MKAVRLAGSPRVSVWISWKVWPTGFAVGVGVEWPLGRGQGGRSGRGSSQSLICTVKRLALLFEEKSQILSQTPLNSVAWMFGPWVWSVGGSPEARVEVLAGHGRSHPHVTGDVTPQKAEWSGRAPKEPVGCT